MASSPNTSWQIEGENVEALTDFLFLGSKITVNGDCSHEIRRWLLLGRKAMTSQDSMFKSRYHIVDKVHLVKAMVFPLDLYWCESWTIKKADSQRIDAFKLWHWRQFLRVHRKARRSNQSILKEINPEYSLEGLTLNLKLQHFGHLMRTADLLEKILMMGKTESRRRRGWDDWMASLIQQTWTWANSRRWWGTGKPDVLQSMGQWRIRHDLITE